MNITKAISTNAGSYPVLKLVIDGHEADVFEPKLTQLKKGVVILLDSDGHWKRTLAERYDTGAGRIVQLHGATRDLKLIALVRRFIAGEKGDLLAPKAARSTGRRSRANLKQ